MGRIDILVCNAAANPYYGPLAKIPDTAMDKVLENNVKSVVWLSNLVLPQMAERRDGVIIIISWSAHDAWLKTAHRAPRSRA